MDSISAKNTFNTLAQVYRAAKIWYGDYSLNSCCLAECRLMRGERP